MYSKGTVYSPTETHEKNAFYKYNIVHQQRCSYREPSIAFVNGGCDICNRALQAANDFTPYTGGKQNFPHWYKNGQTYSKTE
jgi:hypothetical protein